MSFRLQKMKAFRRILLTGICVLSINAMYSHGPGGGPPPPPGGGDPGSGGDPVGGGAPLGNGTIVLMALGVSYGARKIYLAYSLEKIEGEPNGYRSDVDRSAQICQQNSQQIT